MLLDLEALRDYGKWIDQTTWDVYHSVIRVGGWQQVFPGPLPVWASRIRRDGRGAHAPAFSGHSISSATPPRSVSQSRSLASSGCLSR